jgi:pimeloyl-ACP methyl ester carboxylesterase
MEVMGRDFALFAPDTRGFGETDKPRIRVTLDLLARDLIDFMDSLGIERAVLVGHDFGGMIATIAALQYGERFSRLAILDSTATVWIPWGSHGYWFKVEGLAEEFLARHHRDFIDAIFLGGAIDIPAMPAGPFPGARAFPSQSWCDAESLEQYRNCYRDPDSQWSAISYYRDALPFHRLGERGFELIQPREIEEMWLREGGYFTDPSFGEFHAYAPERTGQRYEGEVLYFYKAVLPPPGFPGTSASTSTSARPDTVSQGGLPIGGNPAAAAFADHFPRMTAVPVEGGHFIPEQEPAWLAENLRGWLAPSRAPA